MKIKPDSDAERYRSTVDTLSIMLMAALSVVLIIVGLRFSFMQDDAFILFRYVSNLLAGQGLVFNTGEWVEGFTCPLWVAILAAVGKLGLDLVIWSPWLGLGLAVATLWVVFVVGRALLDEKDPWWWALLAPMILATNSSFASFATSGLETSLFAFLLIATTAVSIRALRENRFPVWLSLGYVLLTLTRPEGAFIFAISWLYGFSRMAKGRSGIIRMILSLTAYLVPMAIVTIWRWYIYGYPLPNPAYAKVILDRQSLIYGLEYGWRFLVSYGWFGLLLMVAALPALLVNSYRKAWRYLGILFLIFALYIVAIGGDVLKGLRFFVPILPIYALLIQGGIGIIRRGVCRNRSLRLANGIAIGAIVLLLAGQAATYPSESHRARLENGLTDKMRALAEWFVDQQSPETIVAANSIGALGYYTGYRMVDMVGLVDEAIAHNPEFVKGLRSPAKERTYDAGRVLSQCPDFIVFDTNEKPNHAGDFALYLRRDFRRQYYRYPIWKAGHEEELVIFKTKGVGRDTCCFGDSTISEESVDFVKALREGMIHAESDPQKAEMYFQRALDLGPGDFAQPLEWLGMLALDQGNRVKAQDYFHRAVAVDSFSVYAIRYLAKMTYNDGNMAEALEWAQRLLRMDSHIPDGWLMTGWILHERGQREDALRYWREGLNILRENSALIGIISSIK